MVNKLQRDADAGQSAVSSIPVNSIFTLKPYKHYGIYVFDFPEWGTVKEAFVGGATEFLQMVSGDAETFLLLFSVEPFKAYEHEVELLHSEPSGSDYYSREYDHQLWLCSYLFRFYDKAPERIYLQIKHI